MLYFWNHDDLLTLVILFTPVNLLTLFWSYNQFYRAECITVSGFFLYIIRMLNVRCSLAPSLSNKTKKRWGLDSFLYVYFESWVLLIFKDDLTSQNSNMISKVKAFTAFLPTLRGVLLCSLWLIGPFHLEKKMGRVGSTWAGHKMEGCYIFISLYHFYIYLLFYIYI